MERCCQISLASSLPCPMFSGCSSKTENYELHSYNISDLTHSTKGLDLVCMCHLFFCLLIFSKEPFLASWMLHSCFLDINVYHFHPPYFAFNSLSGSSFYPLFLHSSPVLLRDPYPLYLSFNISLCYL